MLRHLKQNSTQEAIHKLAYYGIRGSTHKWIKSWLSGRTQQVVLDGQASDPVPVLSGVPQGAVVGPVLFLILINDLPDNIRSSVRLFADDCADALARQRICCSQVHRRQIFSHRDPYVFVHRYNNIWKQLLT